MRSKILSVHSIKLQRRSGIAMVAGICLQVSLGAYGEEGQAIARHWPKSNEMSFTRIKVRDGLIAFEKLEKIHYDYDSSDEFEKFAAT